MQDDAAKKPTEEKPTESPEPSGGTPPPPAGQFTPPVNSAGMFPHEPSKAAGSTTSAQPTGGSGLPKGVYVVATLNILGFVFSFFDTSQNNFWYMAVMFAGLLLAIALLLRQSWARLATAGVAGLTVVVSLVMLVTFVSLQNHIHQLKNQYNTALKNSQQQGTLTSDQQLQLDNFQATITRQESQVGRSFMFVYIKYGVTVVVMALIAWYLTRPTVREAFG